MIGATQNAATAHGAPPIALPGAVTTTITMPPNPAARRTHDAAGTRIPVSPLSSTTHSGIAAARIAPRVAVTAVSATVASPWPPTSSSTPAAASRRSCPRVGRGRPRAAPASTTPASKKTSAAPPTGGTVATISFIAGIAEPQHA